MIEIGNSLFLPENAPGSAEILGTLLYFGLKEDRFTFAPASGGVVAFSLDHGILWFPKTIMDLLGVQMIRSRGVEETLQYLGEIAGARAGWAVGWSAGGAAAAVAAFAGVSTGLWIPIAAGTFLGSQIGTMAMKRLGFRGPPKELAAYPLLLIDHLEILSPSYIVKAYEQTMNLLAKSSQQLIGKKGETKNSALMTIVKRFKASTEEMKRLSKKMQDQKAKKKNIVDVVGDVVGGAVDILTGTHSVFDLLDTQAETFVFSDPSHYGALVESIKLYDVNIVEK